MRKHATLVVSVALALMLTACGTTDDMADNDTASVAGVLTTTETASGTSISQSEAVAVTTEENAGTHEDAGDYRLRRVRRGGDLAWRGHRRNLQFSLG